MRTFRPFLFAARRTFSAREGVELFGLLRTAFAGTAAAPSRLIVNPAGHTQFVIDDAFVDASRGLPGSQIVHVTGHHWLEPGAYTIVWEVAGCESPPIAIDVRDATVLPEVTALSLEAIPEVLGVAHEPVLVLRIHNGGPASLDAAEIIGASTIVRDGTRAHYIPRTWDGAFGVPPGDAMAWLLARDDFAPELTAGQIHLESGGLSSNTVELT